MPVTLTDVEKIAKLAKLRFSEEELKSLTKDMNKILDYMDKLNELDTTNVEPLLNPISNENVFREDKLVESIPTEEALKNAPDRTDVYFRVPKVISKE
ncbi:Asp-tRNA(Asn)/Glu-tRNA(Gln) amidotransferase subunit GatC [Melioribacteraceae bacterium 4301-Me]|uniref:Asp-tRNA(Asn)/Glu-tRNA(Gln) amidotransferase subunit GatC n=1 Tax=Pyranulibacter aquaticus TaxID=3163344 RepID=UPI003594DEA4